MVAPGLSVSLHNFRAFTITHASVASEALRVADPRSDFVAAPPSRAALGRPLRCFRAEKAPEDWRTP